jgi:hypothetical protein
VLALLPVVVRRTALDDRDDACDAGLVKQGDAQTDLGGFHLVIGPIFGLSDDRL